MKYTLLLSLSFVLSIIHAQTPASKYYYQINLAEKALIEGDLDSALSIYKNTFNRFDYPFTKNIQQGLYVACHASNQNITEIFLSKAVENGMSETNFNYFKELWVENNPQTRLSLNYDSLRVHSLERLDTTLLFKFLEIDAYRDFLLKKYDRKDSLSIRGFFSEIKILRDDYIDLIETEGYPAENIVGAGVRWRLVKKIRKKHENCLIHKLSNEKWNETKYKFIIVKHPVSLSSFKPGNWFLTHYTNTDNQPVIDTALFRTLEKGFNYLKIDPVIIPNAMESTRELENEFALTYYSQLWAYDLKFSFNEKFALDKEVKTIINKNRTNYYMRTLEQEELLYKALYKLKYNEVIKGNISVETTQALKKEVDLFLIIFK